MREVWVAQANEESTGVTAFTGSGTDDEWDGDNTPEVIEAQIAWLEGVVASRAELEASAGLPTVLIHPGPGEECPQCRRRVPHTRKETTPRETHPLTFGRAPSDITDELKERVNALAQDAGLTSLPYHQARTVMLLLTIAESVDAGTLKAVAGGMSWGTGKGDE